MAWLFAGWFALKKDAMKVCQLLVAVPLAAAALAAERVLPDAPPLQVGDCVVYREGGVGRILTTPTYWLKGRVAAIAEQRKLARLCPQTGRPLSSYRYQDWISLAQAQPCVDSSSEIREMTMQRLTVEVDEWESPWSNQHGAAGLLFRGEFLGLALKKGGLIEVDARWLTRCAAS